MGKIKSKLVKRSSKEFIQRGVKFSNNFEENKKVLGKNMPSKKIRNQIAGYISKMNLDKK